MPLVLPPDLGSVSSPFLSTRLFPGKGGDVLSDKWPIICRSNCSNTATIGPPVSSSDTFADCVWSLNEARSTCLGVGSLGRLAGRRLLSRGHSLLDTAALLLWGGSRPALPALPAGHDGAVGSVCWSHDSRWVLSASQDGTLRVWSVRRPEPLLRLVTGVPGRGRRGGRGPRPASPAAAGGGARRAAQCVYTPM